MKTKNIATITIALLLGLALGYFIFSGKEDKAEVKETDQIWTCSMHPQIRKNEPGDCPICGMDLIPLGETSEDPLTFSMTRDAMKLADIQTTKVKAVGNQTKVIELSGKIEANETTNASIVSHIPGRIEKLYISYTGERVSKGQAIAQIYSPELVTAQRELLEANKMTDKPYMLESAMSKLKYWKITEEQVKEIIESGEITELFTIYADHSGVVKQRNVTVGDYIKKGQVLYGVQNLNSLWVLFDAYEKDLSLISKGDIVSFSTAAFPDKKFEATVTFIDPVVNPKTRTVSIRAEVVNTDNLLKPDMFVKGTIEGHINSKARLIIPKTAVIWTGKRSVVYLKDPTADIPTFTYREVVLGDMKGDSYYIIEGLEKGDYVVSNGAFIVDASAQLNNSASMMNRLVTGTKEEVPDFINETPEAFNNQLENLYMAYVDMKDAFVASNADLAKEKSQLLLEAMGTVNMKLLKGEAHVYWMEQMKAIEHHTKMIVKKEDIEDQRQEFEHVSKAIINTTKAFGVSEKELYVQYCPMAFNDKGAFWLSDDSEIKNPYFGEKMLKCGSVEDTIKRKK